MCFHFVVLMKSWIRAKNITLELSLAAIDAENVKSGPLLQFLFWYSLSWNRRHAVSPALLSCDPAVAAMGGLGEGRLGRERWAAGQGAISRVRLCRAERAGAVMYAQPLIPREVPYGVSDKGILRSGTSAWKTLVQGGKCNLYVNSSCVT